MRQNSKKLESTISKLHFSDAMLMPMINALPVGTLLATKDGEIIFSNPKAEELLGFDSGELLGCPINRLVPERYHKSHEQMRESYMDAPSQRAMNQGRVLPAVKKNGQEVQVQIGLSPLTVDNNNYVLVSIIEVSNQVFKIAAYHDPLTGLANRNLFNELSENLRNSAIRNGAHLTLLFIDLDGFKDVNDLYGHYVGDLVLCEVANALTKSVRKNDIIGRIGGDEFLICLYGIENTLDLEKIFNNLIKVISSIENIQGHRVKLNASIGAISTAEPDNVLLNEMVKTADKLMYKAKKAGKGKAFYEEC